MLAKAQPLGRRSSAKDINSCEEQSEHSNTFKTNLFTLLFCCFRQAWLLPTSLTKQKLQPRIRLSRIGKGGGGHLSRRGLTRHAAPEPHKLESSPPPPRPAPHCSLSKLLRFYFPLIQTSPLRVPRMRCPHPLSTEGQSNRKKKEAEDLAR